MKITKTPGGADVIEMTREEWDEFLERRVQKAAGMSVAEFRSAYLAGELADGEVGVDEVLPLVFGPGQPQP